MMNIDHPHHATHVRVGIITTAVLLTVAFHFLVAEHWFGLGLAIFSVLLVIGIHVIDVLAAKPNNTWAYIFFVPLITSAVAECVYDSGVVRGLALPLMVISAALFAYWFTAPRVGFWEAPVLWPATAIMETIWPYRGVGGLTTGFTKIDRVRKVTFGLLIAAPVVLVIGILFSRADAVFGKAIFGFFDISNISFNLWRIVRDFAVVSFLVAAGWKIYTRVIESRKAKAGSVAVSGDRTIIVTFLAVLNVLFLVFIAFQAIAFFGGEPYIQAQGISYADYARQGFFQLLAVAGIVFVIMVAVYRFTHLQQWGSRLLSMALIVETGVIIISAIRRLQLYIDTYGLTLSRYWAMVVIIIIGVVLASLLVGALAKIKYEPMIRSIFIGFIILAPFLLLVNVNDRMIKFNFDRFMSGQTDQFDVDYFIKGRVLSDSVPALVSAVRLDWPKTSKEDLFARANLYSALNQKMQITQRVINSDWRNAVVADYRALAALGAIKDLDLSKLVPEKSIGNVDASTSYYLYGAEGYGVLFAREIGGDLTISVQTIKSTKLFPMRVTGNLIIKGADGALDLPIDEIYGSIDVQQGTIDKFGTMPKTIGNDLILDKINVGDMLPAGIKIGGSVYVSSNLNKAFMEGFIKDAQGKGYRVVDVDAPKDLKGFVPGPCGTEINPCPGQVFLTR